MSKEDVLQNVIFTHWDFFVSFSFSFQLWRHWRQSRMKNTFTIIINMWIAIMKMARSTFHISFVIVASSLFLMWFIISFHEKFLSQEILNNFTNNTKYLTTVLAHSRDSYILNFLVFHSLTSWQSSSSRWILNVWQRDNEPDRVAEPLLGSSLPLCLHVPSRPRTILIYLNVDETTTEQSRISLVTEYYFYEQTR